MVSRNTTITFPHEAQILYVLQIYNTKQHRPKLHIDGVFLLKLYFDGTFFFLNDVPLLYYPFTPHILLAALSLVLPEVCASLKEVFPHHCVLALGGNWLVPVNSTMQMRFKSSLFE